MDDGILGQRCILLVDDNDIALTVIREILESFGCCVISARNGQEALAAFEKHKEKINTIITDVRMPVLDGISMISQIRLLDRDIPIIVITGFANTDIHKLAGRLEFAVFNKPVRIEDLERFLIEAPLHGLQVNQSVGYCSNPVG